MEKRKWRELTIEERAQLSKERLIDPETDLKEFASTHNVLPVVIKKIESLINFDEDVAVQGLIWNVLKRDSELLDMASEINLKFAEQVGNRKQIQAREIDTLDKLSNTAMKRAALVAAAQEKEEGGTIDIVLTI